MRKSAGSETAVFTDGLREGNAIDCAIEMRINRKK
jgi:hypothetical protein